MNKKSLRSLFVSCAALCLSHSAFSQDLGSIFDWEKIGAVNLQGTNTAFLYTAANEGYPTVSAAQLSAFFGGISLPGNIEGAATDGSGGKVSFTLSNSSPVAFAYRLITDEGGDYDRAFVFVDGKQYTLGSNSLSSTPGLSSSNAAGGLDRGTPLSVLVITGLAPGQHTVGVGVYDTGDESDPSGVEVKSLGGVEDALAIAVDQRQILLSLAGLATRDVGGRLFALRAGADENDEGVTTLALATSDGKSTVDGKGGDKGGPAPVAPQANTWEFYGTGNYGYADSTQTTVADYVSDSYAGSVGVEYHVTPRLTLGLAYTHLENRTEFANNIGKLRIRGDAVTPYASFTLQNFYAEALYSYSTFDDEILPNAFTAGGATKATPSSANHTANIDLGYNLHFGQLVTGPFAGADYTTGGLAGFVQTGGLGGVALQSQSYDSLVSRVGWQASYRIPTHFGSVTPQIRASWDRENLDDAATVGVTAPNISTSVLNVATGTITAGGPFSPTATTAAPDRDYLDVGAGVMVQLWSRGTVVLDYEDHLFRNDYSERFAAVKLGVSF